MSPKSGEKEPTEDDHQKYSVTEKHILRKEYSHAFPGVQTPASLDISGWHSQSQDYYLAHKPRC